MTKAKAKSKKKKLGTKTIQRKGVISPALCKKMVDDFSDMCNTCWRIVENKETLPEKRFGLLQTIVGICEVAWNISIQENDMEHVFQFIAGCFPVGSLYFNFVYAMVKFKYDNFSEDRAIIKDAQGYFGPDGKPVVSLYFDYSRMEEEARGKQMAMPRLENIIDLEALERATAGLPPDKVEEARNAELKRQIDAYNNTPQAELGGKTPNQVLNEQWGSLPGIE